MFLKMLNYITIELKNELDIISIIYLIYEKIIMIINL